MFYLSLAAGAGNPNPIADPFAATRKEEPSPIPKPVDKEITPPSPSLPNPGRPLPNDLRVILVRDNGQGLLGSMEAGALSIPVINDNPVQIAGRMYYTEIKKMTITLYSEAGYLVWEGTLSGMMPSSVPPEISQMKFVPPLSAGVDPGLKNQSSSKP